MALGREGQLKKGNLLRLISQTAADQSKLVSYTDRSGEEEDLHVDVDFDEPIELAIN